MAGLRVVSDAPVDLAGDSLRFARYVEPLVQMLRDPQAQTPFTVGIYGTWGSGKSSLLRMVSDTLCANGANDFVCVPFNPWIHRRESNMLVPLLHTLNDALSTQQGRFAAAVKNVGRILLALGSDILLKKLTADVVSLGKLSEASKAVVEETGKVESEMRKLRTTLQAVADSVHERGAQLVLLVDDLDRCQPDQIIDVLESVKLFLDLRHVFVLLAVDKEVVDRGIRVRFKDFAFAQRERAIGEEYLDKMVQLPLSLFPLRAAQVGSFIEALQPGTLVNEHHDLLKVVVQPNPRKIKRIVNLLNVAEAIAGATPDLQLERDLLVRLVVLQVQSAELYQDIVQLPDLLVALEAVSQGKKKIDQQLDFQEFDVQRDAIQALCKTHHRPGSYLDTMLAVSTFRNVRADLRLYLSLAGG